MYVCYNTNFRRSKTIIAHFKKNILRADYVTASTFKPIFSPYIHFFVLLGIYINYNSTLNKPIYTAINKGNSHISCLPCAFHSICKANRKNKFQIARLAAISTSTTIFWDITNRSSTELFLSVKPQINTYRANNCAKQNQTNGTRFVTLNWHKSNAYHPKWTTVLLVCISNVSITVTEDIVQNPFKQSQNWI